MKSAKFDIDVDLGDRTHLLDQLQHVTAMRLEKGQTKPHNSGIYVQPIPSNPLTNYANIEYKEAANRGYLKLDILNVNLYRGVRDENHLVKLMNEEPLWDLLKEADFVNMLFHLNGHSEILKKNPPTDIPQLAAVLAMIRPSKRYLVGKTWDEIFKESWIKSDDGYFFKKSHAHAYATAIVVQMNLICESMT